MPTSASYAVVVGEERIVSVINENGIGVPVPKLDTTLGGAYAEQKGPDKGNRKILLAIQIDAVGDPEQIRTQDQIIAIRVKVPAGVIRGGLQRFKADASVPGYTTNPLDFAPLVKIIPGVGTNGAVGPYTINAQVWGTFGSTPPNLPEEDKQTIVVLIVNNGGDDPLAFFVEIDWGHSINN